MQDFHNEFGVHTAMGEEPAGTPTKRAGNQEGTPDPKRLRVTQGIPTGLTELASIAMVQKGQPGLMIKMFLGNVGYVVNPTGNELMLPVGSVLLGFGRGKFKIDAAEDATRTHLFQVERSSDLVLHNNKVLDRTCIQVLCLQCQNFS